MPHPPDPTLRSAFERLHAAHGEAARQFARLKLGAALRRRVDSEDVQQEAFLEAWRSYREREDVRQLPDDAFARWLGGVVHNKVLNLANHHVKAGRRSVRREERQATPEDRSRGRSPSEIASREELRARLEKGVAQLSPREQEVVRLVHFKGLRVAEAARQMGKTPGATSVLLCQALAKLEERMGMPGGRTS